MANKVVNYIRIIFVILFFYAYLKHNQLMVLYLILFGLIIGAISCLAFGYYTWVDRLETKLMRSFVYPIMSTGDQWYSPRSRVKKWKEKGKLKTYSLINLFGGILLGLLALWVCFEFIK